MTTTAPSGRATLPGATTGETLAVLAEVVAPVVARGIILRRPKVVAMAERLDLDRRAVRRMQRLRDRYGTGPLLLRMPPGMPRALILAPEHVHRVLDGSPEPFATLTSEKRAALAHFQPRGVLISHGPDRTERRRFNEAVLETGRPVHRLADDFLRVVAEEVAGLLDEARARHGLDWDRFIVAWYRMVRRVVLGDAARDDHHVTDVLARLRADANWAFLWPKRTTLLRRFHRRVSGYLARAEPGSLAGIMAATPTTSRTAPTDQVGQWLFAFDAAAIATFRALALLATHPEQHERARTEIGSGNGAARGDLPYLRACVLESVRLWPTTPVILRQTTAETTWEAGVMPAGTGIAIFAPFFHRDDARLPYADCFAPEVWLEDQSAASWSLVPFSGGPAVCPGRDLTLLLSSAVLATLLVGRRVRLMDRNRLDARRPLPAPLNNYSLRFDIAG